MITYSARTLAAAFALTGAMPLAASAQTAPATTASAPAASGAIMPGMAVVDPNGGAVGTVSSVNGDQLIIKTAKHEVQLPATSFTPDKGKLLFALTQAQLDAQTEQAIAEGNAKLVVGASVYGTSGAQVGTISAVDDQLFTLKLTSGKLIRIPRTALAPGAQGAVLGISAAELQKLTEQAK